MEYWEGWLNLTNRWGKMNGVNIPVAPIASYRVCQATLDEAKEVVLASVQSQIEELEVKLGSMTNTTAHRDRITLVRAIKGKKDYMYRTRFTGDFFSILAPEHIELIRMVLEHRKVNGTL